MAEETPRERLLLHMYDQLFNDINRHIIVVWQSVSVVVGAFAVLALVEKQIVTIDLGIALILILCGWLIANLLDAAYWYNRNLVMIANIERQFLTVSDKKEIHYYFTAHRPNNKMITHLRIQAFLGIAVGALVLFFHVATRVWPGLSAPASNFDLQRTLPYVALTVVGMFVHYVKGQRDRSYAEFVENSPGKEIDASGIKYGEGHGFKKPK